MNIYHMFSFEPFSFLFLFLKEMVNNHFMLLLVLIFLKLSQVSFSHFKPLHYHKYQKKKRERERERERKSDLSDFAIIIPEGNYHNFFSFHSTASYLKFLLEPERLLYSRISPKTKLLVTIAALPSSLLNPQQNAARNALRSLPRQTLLWWVTNRNNRSCSCCHGNRPFHLSRSIPGFTV